MASSSKAPKVSAIVDEDGGVVTVGVEHEGAFLPVASASLDYAKARNLDAKGEPSDDENNEGGDK